MHFSTYSLKVLLIDANSFEFFLLSQMPIECMVPEILSATNIFFSHFGPFFPLLPPNNPKNQNFEKMKRMPGDIIILHMSTMNNNHMMYGS